ncbi:hypothetical protein ACP4OV_023296 [Aristida adscensionis]
MEAAVVSAAQGAIGTLLGKLGTLLTDKYKLANEAKEHIIFLKAELESMHAFLKKMSDKDEPDEQDKCWAKEVRELSYDIEDGVSEFLHHADHKPSGFKGFIKKSLKLLTIMNTRLKIAKEFEGLKNRVVEVSQRHRRYKVDDVASIIAQVTQPSNTAIDLRLLALYAETAGLVGIEGPREELIQWLSEQTMPASQLKVLSIVGFGGLGKTTLAKEICHKLEGQYQCQAFVPVSQRPDTRKILRTILSQVGYKAPKNTNIERWDQQELITALQKFLLDKRYLIVIDDIWDGSAWEIVRCALPENKNDSRVITTTRIESVARACANQSGYVYKMKQLSHQDSRRLFFKRIFGPEYVCPLYLEDVSTRILKKCGGLPLAIITISSLLANEPNKQKEWWEYVLNSLGSGLEVGPSLEGMRQILDLSYIHLPHYLKTCMLYLAIYPEDYTINRKDLTRQWVAEGFIGKAAHGADLETVAKSYFNDLINRSMMQPIDSEYNGEVMSCKVHDMMLDLILRKSRQENFITVLDDIQDIVGCQDKIRRLSLHLDAVTDDKVVRSVQLCQTRTLARFGTSSYLPPFLQFKHLRVLTIEISVRSQSKALIDLTGVRHLFQLRYLKIIVDSLSVVFPGEIGGLYQLETFEVKAPKVSSKALLFRGRVLPSDIIYMDRLLHLSVPRWTKLPDGIRNMKSLRTLYSFDFGRNTFDCIRGIRELTCLEDLDIECSTGNRNTTSRDELVQRGREVLHTCLEMLCNLKHFRISTDISDPYCLDISIKFPASSHRLQRFNAIDFPGSQGFLIGLANSITSMT